MLMSRSRLAPESLKRVSNLIPGILVPDSHRGTNSPRLSYYINDVSLVRCYVDEKSDSISTLAGYHLENFAFRYNCDSTFFSIRERKEIDLPLVREIRVYGESWGGGIDGSANLASPINPARADDSLSLSGDHPPPTPEF